MASKEALFSEGQALRTWCERLDFLVHALLSRCPPQTAPATRAAAASLLLALQLNEDNARAALPTWEQHPLRPAVLWLVDALRTAALSPAGGVAPAGVVGIEAFSRGAARVYDGDGDDLDALDECSFLKWNLCALERVRSRVASEPLLAAAAAAAADRAVVAATALLQETPEAKLTSFCTQAVGCTQEPQRALVHCSLVFQQLLAENERAKLFRSDPYLSNAFERVRHELQTSTQSLLNIGQQRALGDAVVQAMAAWSRTYTLLYAKGPLQLQPQVLLCKNECILKRLAAVVSSGPLCEALLAAAAEVAKRQRPQEQPYAGEQSRELQAATLADIASKLC